MQLFEYPNLLDTDDLLDDFERSPFRPTPKRGGRKR